MYTNNSPLEHLAAFAIVFVAGAITTAISAKWIEKMEEDGLVGPANHVGRREIYRDQDGNPL